jgi:TetR/AcrR family transcriptional repressor of mexCD-oprJ operon
MPRVTKSLRNRTQAAILEAAARVLARRGEAATIGEVAVEAGIGRATVYRYFKTREQLVSALWEAALAEVDERLAAAGLEQVPFEEGVARTVRSIATVGERYELLLRERSYQELERGREVLGARISALFERGREEGALREDLPLELVGEIFGGLVLSGLQLAFQQGLGIERASAVLVDVFLNGVGSSRAAGYRSDGETR